MVTGARGTPVPARRHPVALPCEDVVVPFGRTVHPMFNRIRACMDESRSLATLRDYLYPKLLSAEVLVGI